MRKRLWLIIGFTGGLAIAAALLVFVWLPSRQPATVSPTTGENVSLQKGELEAIAGYKKAPVPETLVQNAPMAQWVLPAFKELEFKSLFEQEKEKVSEEFVAPLVFPSLPAFFSSFLPSSGNAEKPLQIEKKRTNCAVSDEEWFKIAYPSEYLKFLSNLQEIMIKQGTLPETARISLSSGEEVNFFLREVINSAFGQGLIDEQRRKEANYIIDTIIPAIRFIPEEARVSSMSKEDIETKLRCALTEEEWFKIVYPSSYLDYLRVMENAMRQAGFSGQTEKFEFTSDENIKLFLSKFIDFALQQNWLSQTEAERAKYGLNTVIPNIQKEERIRVEKEMMEKQTEEGPISFLWQAFKTAFGNLLPLVYAQLDFSRPWAGLDLSEPFGGLDVSLPFLGLLSGGGGGGGSSGGGGGGLNISEPYLGLDLSEPFGGLDFSEPFLGLFGLFGGGGGGGGGGFGGFGGGGFGGFGGDCYREGSGGSGGSGYNTFAICCNCGLNCEEDCYYVEDCDQGSCDVDLGCKNLMCSGNKPMIWDQGSFTCGCG